MLNPTATSAIHQLSSPPLSPQHDVDQVDELYEEYHCNKRNSTSSMSSTSSNGGGKPRSRFSNIEDAIICEGVARGLTWGQISGQLPHRKRATCFNRYRTLQGIRKSRKRSSELRSPPITPPSWSSSNTPSPKEQHRHHSHHPYHNYNTTLPVLVAPLPTRLPLPYTSYASDRLH